jgi:hypothetical protein
MDKFLKDLQEKSKKLVEIADADDAIKQGKKLLKGLKRTTLLKAAIKELGVFYSEENVNAIKNMIQHDLNSTTSVLNKKENSLTSLQQKYGKSTTSTLNLDNLNFFDIYLELKTQEVLQKKYPEYILSSEDQSAKHKELMGSLNTLQSKLSTLANKKGQSAKFNAKLKAKNKEIKDYEDLISLIK